MKKMIILVVAVLATAITFAQNNEDKKTEKVINETAKYTCPMHPEIVSGQPGKCSKCGMDLVKSGKDKDEMKHMYSCPMHPEMLSGQPGKCSKCGMDLVKSGKDKDEMKYMYSCPMHPEVKEFHKSKCPKCGMDLVKMKSKSRKH